MIIHGAIAVNILDADRLTQIIVQRECVRLIFNFCEAVDVTRAGAEVAVTIIQNTVCPVDVIIGPAQELLYLWDVR